MIHVKVCLSDMSVQTFLHPFYRIQIVPMFIVFMQRTIIEAMNSFVHDVQHQFLCKYTGCIKSNFDHLVQINYFLTGVTSIASVDSTF